MQKILVIGPGGAGKTTFAKELGEILGIMVVHLDSLYWKLGWIEPPKREWAAVLAVKTAKRGVRCQTTGCSGRCYETPLIRFRTRKPSHVETQQANGEQHEIESLSYFQRPMRGRFQVLSAMSWRQHPNNNDLGRFADGR